MGQLLAHLIGDYVLQSHFLALNKKKSSNPNSSYYCTIHALLYCIPFLLFGYGILSVILIGIAHYFVDHSDDLIPTLIKTKNEMLDIEDKYDYTDETGFPADTPAYLSTWLNIIMDNTVHLTINYLIIAVFG